MKKVLIAFVLLGMVFAFVGCASTAKVAELAAPVVPLVLGADGVPQPDWIYKTVSTKDRHFESGYGKMSDKPNSIKRATGIIDIGNGDDRQAMDAMESISEQVAEATLSGVSTEEMWIDAEGGVWILCSIPLANIEQRFEPAAAAVADAFSESGASDAAQAKMKDSFASLLKKTK